MTEHHYIYLQQEREFFNKKENVYKLGKTTQTIDKRFGGYPKGTLVISVINVISSDDSERELLGMFRNEFVNRTDIGAEYFQGNLIKMIQLLQKHHLEQIKQDNVAKTTVESAIRYENTAVEFLDKRTLPVLAKDGRKPLFEDPADDELFEMYKQWCKDLSKKSVTKKFFVIWWHKRKDALIFENGVFVYNVDPKEELAECDTMEWAIDNWLWYFTSFFEQIAEDRRVLCHAINISDIPKFPGGMTSVSFCQQALKFYPRNGHIIHCVVYLDPLIDHYLVDESPWTITEKPPFGWSDCWKSRAYVEKLPQLTHMGWEIQNTWLETDYGPGLIWTDLGESILVCQYWGGHKYSYPQKDFKKWNEAIAYLENLTEIKKRKYRTFWSGQILFIFNNGPYETLSDRYLLGFGLENSWHNKICFVWSRTPWEGTYFQINQLEWTLELEYKLKPRLTEKEIVKKNETKLEQLLQANSAFHIYDDKTYEEYFKLTSEWISVENPNVNWRKVGIEQDLSLTKEKWKIWRESWPRKFDQKLKKYEKLISNEKFLELKKNYET